MIPAYDMNEWGKQRSMIRKFEPEVKLSNEDFQSYIQSSVQSEDPELINRVIKNWVKYKNIEFVDMVILGNIIDNYDFLNKMAIVSDFSYRNCCLRFKYDGVTGRAQKIGSNDLETAFNEWESKGFEKLFIMVDNWEILAKEEVNLNALRQREVMDSMDDYFLR